MKIGIIGSGIAGLAAGRMLVKAGHEVTVIERNTNFGGKLVSLNDFGETSARVDMGVPYFTTDTSEFSSFIAELVSNGLVKKWGESFSFHDGVELLPDNPNRSGKTRYAAVNGMSSISKYLGRHCDFLLGDQAGGITNVGVGREKKRPWMINLTSFRTFEADAIIIAIPAPEAYGIIMTTQDEIETFKAIREIDVINYDPSIILATVYKGSELPSWDGIESRDDIIGFISNETRKRTNTQPPSLAVHSTPDFARKSRDMEPGEIKKIMLDRLKLIAGSWAGSPEWTDLRHWSFHTPKQVLEAPYFHIGGREAPLALVGDYFQNGTVEGAYCSGTRLARSWISMFDEKKYQPEERPESGVIDDTLKIESQIQSDA